MASPERLHKVCGEGGEGTPWLGRFTSSRRGTCCRPPALGKKQYKHFFSGAGLSLAGVGIIAVHRCCVGHTPKYTPFQQDSQKTAAVGFADCYCNYSGAWILLSVHHQNSILERTTTDLGRGQVSRM